MAGRLQPENIYRAFGLCGFVEILQALVSRGEGGMSAIEVSQLVGNLGYASMTARHTIRSMDNLGLIEIKTVNPGRPSAHNPLVIRARPNAKKVLDWHKQSEEFRDGFKE